jgi:outer membrane protein
MQAWRDALVSDPTYAAARAAYRAGLERQPQARANLLPYVSAEAGGEYRDVRSTSGFRRDTSGTRGTWDLVLTQPLFDWGSYKAYEQSKLVVADVEVQLQQAFQDLLLRVSDAYFNVLSFEDQLAATVAEKSAIAEQVESAQRNFELGNATITDTYEAQSRYDLIVAQELQLQNLLEVQRDRLTQIIGNPPGSLARLPSGTALPPPQPARLEAWSSQAQSASLEVVRAELQTRIAQRDIEIARSGAYPIVALRASSGSATDARLSNPGSGRPIDNTIGVVVSMPFYTGGAVSSRVTESVQLQQRARFNAETSRRQALQLARQYYTGVTTGLLRVRALEAGERSSRSAVEANRLGYEVGVRINLDVLNAEQQLYATQRDLAQVRYNTLMDGLRLKATSGILAEADLDAINRLLRFGPPATQQPVSPRRSDGMTGLAPAKAPGTSARSNRGAGGALGPAVAPAAGTVGGGTMNGGTINGDITNRGTMNSGAINGDITNRGTMNNGKLNGSSPVAPVTPRTPETSTYGRRAVPPAGSAGPYAPPDESRQVPDSAPPDFLNQRGR